MVSSRLEKMFSGGTEISTTQELGEHLVPLATLRYQGGYHVTTIHGLPTDTRSPDIFTMSPPQVWSAGLSSHVPLSGKLHLV